MENQNSQSPMRRAIRQATRRLTRAANDTSGSATIEAVLWLPIFIALLVLVTDVSFIFYGQSQIYRTIQDANRNLSVGRLKTETDTQNYIMSRISGMAPDATVSTNILNGTVTSRVVVPASDLVAVGLFTNIVALDLDMQSSELVEY